MKNRNMVLNLMALFVFVLAACGGTAQKPEDAMRDKPTEEAMMPKDTPMPDAMAKPTEGAMMEAPAWYGASLTNIQMGDSFTINDLKGKVVLVEMMAVWCPNCKKNQEQVKALHALLGERDDFVSLGLDIDPNENAEALKTYVEDNGFDWYYAVPPAEVSREIASLYGNQFLNPPSTPMLIIDRKGAAHPLPFGIKSADDLMKALQPFLDEAM
jgi:cytochrome oxidase Cu insertion factor (SCO1/SenC/PrrC family)